MSAVWNIRWMTAGDDPAPEWVEVTLADGQKIRYYRSDV